MKAGSSILVALLLAAAACAPKEADPVIVIGAPSAPPAPPHEPEPRAPAPRPVRAAARPSLDAARDPRLRTPRSAALVTTEIQALESLFAATPSTSPDRPTMSRRLAGEYAELELAMQQQGAQAALVHGARQGAIKHYGLLAQQYPKWCASPNPNEPHKSTGCADEALYYLALERERDDDLTGARKTYFQLVQQWPQSWFIPSAYLAFGEMFFAEANTDPSKLVLAEQSYLEVLKYPPPANAVYGYAQYQLARVLAMKGDRPGAAAGLKRALAWAKQHPNAIGAADLGRAAQEELTALGIP